MTKVTEIPDNLQVCSGCADAVDRKQLGFQVAFGALDFRFQHIEQSGIKRPIAKRFVAEAA
jgi:hypothetical protein